jgi:hypothetical protein
MSNDNDTVELVEDELTVLKERADLLKVKYHPSISLDKLREKVNAALKGGTPAEEDKPAAPVAEEETIGQKRKRMKNAMLKLIRIRLSCLNPAKKEWDGEIFTVGNSLMGSITKFVPFNADEGYHVPQILLNQLKDRQCQVFTTVKNSRGEKERKGKLIKEFAIEILPPLTQEELDELARKQALARSID